MKSVYFALILGLITTNTKTAVAEATDFFNLKTLAGYTSTLIPDERTALTLYRQMPTSGFKPHSECFQRAHVWTYDFFKDYKIKSLKAFLFFTKRYQREFNYDWFYHVAPALFVQTDQGPSLKVFDPTFISSPDWVNPEQQKLYDNKPLSLQAWAQYFLIPQADCPVIENYTEFEENQETHYCYVMISPMYTYIPANLETEAPARTSWREDDLQQMLKAFKMRGLK